MSIDNVTDTASRVQYVASASQTAFVYPFPIFADADIVVYVDESRKTLTTDYTVSGATNDTGGTVTFVAGRTAGQVITLWRDTSIQRTVDYQQNGPLTSRAINDDFDRLTVISQELEAAVGRSIRFPQTATVASAGLELSPLASWLGKFLYVNSAGALEPGLVTNTVLSQAVLGGLLQPQTAAEAAAGVTPSNLAWPEGWVPRYGALGAGATETSLIQTALNVGMQGVPVIFPKGKTYIVGQMNVKAGMRILGHGSTSVLKLVANSPSFTRTFTTEANLHDANGDSEILEIDGLCFDGNRLNQGAYTAFQKEHQHSIFVAGQNTKTGRLRTRISNCFFRDTCGDGISIYYNTDTTISNCFFEDCFRSSIACTGGYSRMRISGCRGTGLTHPSAFQVEIDGAGFGGAKTCHLTESNDEWDSGMDLAMDGGSVLELTNVIYNGTDVCIINLDGNLTGVKSVFNATGCYFKIASNSSSTHRFFRFGIAKFKDCTFQWTNNTSHTDLIQPSTLTNQSITFDGCNFLSDSTYHTTATTAVSAIVWAAGRLTITSTAHGIAVNDYVEIAGVTTTQCNGIYRVESVVDANNYRIGCARDPGAITLGSPTSRKRSTLNALSASADTASNMNQYHVVNCNFDAGVDCGFALKQGGWFCMRNNHIDAGLLYQSGAAASFLFETRIGQYTYGAKHRQMGHITGSVPGCLLVHENTFVKSELSTYTVSGNMSSLTCLGNRIIFGTGAALSTDPCIVGDIYRRAVPAASTGQQYSATTSAWAGVAAAWKLETTNGA